MSAKVFLEEFDLSREARLFVERWKGSSSEQRSTTNIGTNLGRNWTIKVAKNA